MGLDKLGNGIKGDTVSRTQRIEHCIKLLPLSRLKSFLMPWSSGFRQSGVVNSLFGQSLFSLTLSVNVALLSVAQFLFWARITAVESNYIVLLCTGSLFGVLQELDFVQLLFFSCANMIDGLVAWKAAM